MLELECIITIKKLFLRTLNWFMHLKFMIFLPILGDNKKTCWRKNIIKKTSIKLESNLRCHFKWYKPWLSQVKSKEKKKPCFLISHNELSRVDILRMELFF